MTAKKKLKPTESQLHSEEWGAKAPLPYWEVWLYIVGWVGAAVYCIYSVYRASIDYLDSLNDYYLVSGWSILGRRKDTSHFEWDFWSGWFLEIWPWYAGHLVLSFLYRKFHYQKRGVVFLLYTQVVLFFLLGFVPLVIIWSHVLLAYLATYTKSKVMVWVTAMGLLLTLNMNKTVKLLKSAVSHDPFERKFYLLLFLLATTNIRYISSAIDIVQQKVELLAWKEKHRKSSPHPDQTPTKRKNERTQPVEHGHLPGKEEPIYVNSLLEMTTYIFYLPLIFTGPLLTFDDFYRQFYLRHNARPSAITLATVITVAKRCFRLIFWIFVIEFSLHYLYFSCLHIDVNLMNRLPLWIVAGIGFCQGQFFMVIYVIMFGLPSLIASADQIETPPGPKCVSRIHLYSDMWKYFDRGLYSFIKKYIYVPIGGSRHGTARQLLASFLCFAFIYVWHGAMDNLFVWTLLNFIGITLETMAGVICQLPKVSAFEHKYLSAATSRRLRALLSVPLLAMSAIAIFFFLAGQQVGYCYFRRLIIEGFPQSTVLITIFLYCCVQVSMETSLWESSKQHLE